VRVGWPKLPGALFPVGHPHPAPLPHPGEGFFGSGPKQDLFGAEIAENAEISNLEIGRSLFRDWEREGRGAERRTVADFTHVRNDPKIMETNEQIRNAIPVSLRGVTKSFGKGPGKVTAVRDFTFDFAPGKLTTLLGPSGCGKTTVLRCLAGFYEPDAGDILIGGLRVNDLPPYERPTGTVFQHYALFPHMTVFENVAYGLKIKKMPPGRIRENVARGLELLQLSGMAERNPNQLSGGQQQRVAIARVLVTEPQVLLFDEPLSNLDAKLRVYMRGEIRALQERLGITTIYVTHDQEEAMSISRTIVIMNQGRIEQEGNPWEIYRQPKTPFAAEFIGTTNFLKGEVAGTGDRSVRVRLPGATLEVPAVEEFRVGEKILVVTRPEMIRFGGEKEEGLPGVIREVSFLGSMARYGVETGGGERIQVDEHNPRGFREKGAAVRLILDPESLHLQRGER
jgi:iron(III) transport system ATP-binding protein